MDEVKVCLPKPENISGGKNIKSFLRQLELSVHHLQKAVEEMERDGEIGENTFLLYKFPFLEKQLTIEKNEVSIHVDELSEEMQEIQIEIVTA